MPNICCRELLYGLIIMFGEVNFGFSIAFTSPLILFFGPYWGISGFQLDLFNAILSGVGIVGPYLASFMMKYMGRRPVFCIMQATTAVLYLIMLAGSKKHFWVFTLMRALMGVTIGSIQATAPPMLVEVAPEGLSGFFGNFVQTGICIGMIIFYLVGNFEVNPAEYNTYRWWSLPIVGAVINALSAAAIWLVPETAPKGEAEDSDQKDSSEKVSMCQWKYTKNLLIGVSLCVVQQFAGINAILTNLGFALEKTKVPLNFGYSATLTTLFILIGAFISSPLIDRMGRKPMFAISCLGCSVCCFVIAVNYKFEWSGWLALVCICLYMAFFGLALGPVPWYIIPELFPLPLRSLGNSVITMSNKLSNCIVLFIYLPMERAWGFMWTAIFFGIVAFIGVPIGLFLMTEPNAALNEKKDEEDEESKIQEEI